MRAKDIAKFITELLGGDEAAVKGSGKRRLLVKICGTRTAEAAKTAVEAGADLVGIILVTGRKRCVGTETALEISRVVHEIPKSGSSVAAELPKAKATDYFQHASQYAAQHPSRALLVGVFLDQPLDYILEQQERLNLDIVQLHGSEPIEWADLIPCPVIHSFKPGDRGLATRGYHALPLLDSGAGGTGQQLAVDKVKDVLQSDEGLGVLLAGGLNAENVSPAIASLGEAGRKVFGVDTSSGVETDGQQDLEKIKAFVKAARGIEV